MELGPDNIRVNAILPGFIGNERTHGVVQAKAQALNISYDEMEGQILSRVSMRQYVPSEDVARMVLFLCSPNGRYVSGQSLSVCGNVESLR